MWNDITRENFLAVYTGEFKNANIIDYKKKHKSQTDNNFSISASYEVALEIVRVESLLRIVQSKWQKIQWNKYWQKNRNSLSIASNN